MSDAVLFPFFDTAARAILFVTLCVAPLFMLSSFSRAFRIAGKRLGLQRAAATTPRQFGAATESQR